MAGDEPIDIKKLEKDKKEHDAETQKLTEGIEKMGKAAQEIQKAFDSNKLDMKTLEQQLEDID
jgi:hypothetical protein